MREAIKIRKYAWRFVFIYFAVGVMALPLPRHEVFPFFSWFLFPLTPSEQMIYGFRVYENDGKNSSGEILNKGLFAFKGENNIDIHYLCQRIGNSIKTENREELQLCIQILEAHYVKSPFHLELVKQNYHPVRRWKEEEMNSFESVWSFKK